MKTEASDRGKKLPNLPQNRFPEAIACHSAKKHGEHKALLLKEKPPTFNE